jgi:hypothetical protein
MHSRAMRADIPNDKAAERESVWFSDAVEREIHIASPEVLQ